MIISQSITDFEQKYVTNDHRKAIYEYFCKYTNDVSAVVGALDFQQWIDGSFITDKAQPGDIDVVSIVPYQENQTVAGYKFSTDGGVKEKYGNVVDAHWVVRYPENDRRYELTRDGLEYYRELFGKDRNKTPKDFFQIERIYQHPQPTYEGIEF